MKTHNLGAAAACGLRVPRTLVTSSPRAARAFVDAVGVGRVVAKAFSATEACWRETRLVSGGELDLLDTVRYAPVIFQQYVPAEVDLRVTVVGGRVFPAAVHSTELDYPVDFRLELDRVRITPATLPAGVRAGLLRLMRRLGLVYGAVDLRRTPAGEHVYLEVNPAGQWLFVEERTGQPVTATLARALAAADHPAGGAAGPDSPELGVVA
jgi:glutathione synthase/RimK-type ligase-like ATP-grasp enzyme